VVSDGVVVAMMMMMMMMRGGGGAGTKVSFFLVSLLSFHLQQQHLYLHLQSHHHPHYY